MKNVSIQLPQKLPSENICRPTVKSRVDLLSAVCFIALLGGCTQHHAFSTSVVKPDAFFGTAKLDNSLAMTMKTVNEQGNDTNKNEVASSSQNFSYSSSQSCAELDYLNLPEHYRVDRPASATLQKNLKDLGDHSIYSRSLPLSPGDMVEISIVNGEGFEGKYIVNPNGKIQLPLIKSIRAESLTVEQLSEKLELALVRDQMFRPGTARVGVRVLHWAPIEVSVAGAVFQAGRVLINEKLPEQVLDTKVDAYGDYAPSRYLSEAIRAASGIRPDAKLDQIILIRNGWQFEVDLTGIIFGTAVNDIPLVAGDQVIVPTTGCFQAALVKPSQITPKGFRVFLSNLIETAKSNSNAAIGQFSSSLPYGTRLLQAAVSANCVGGTSWTNAPRKVLLSSQNPITGRTEIIERSVEKLIRQAHVDEMNPFLMPNDAIACYDSDVTNFRDVAKAIGDILSPFKIL